MAYSPIHGRFRCNASLMTEAPDPRKASRPRDDLIGTTVGRFTISAKLGQGGMGNVYAAEDTVLRRSVAIKRMAEPFRVDPRDRQRFLKEAQRTSALNHPNIAGIYDVLEHDGEMLLVMELIDGITLRTRLKTPIAVDEFIDMATQSAEALDAAHQAGILHGDVKPENIMITATGRVKVLDFGVARRFSRMGMELNTETLETLRAPMSGTPAYMAPEVLLLKQPDGRADIFSLGLVFYEMLGGRQPFLTDSFAGTVGRILHEDPPPLETLNPQVPAKLARILQKMMAKDPSQRYATAREVIADLQAFRRGEPISAGPLKKARSSKPIRFAILGGIAVFVLVAVIIALARHQIVRWFAPAERHAAAQQLPEIKNLVVLSSTPAADPKLANFAAGVVDTLAAKLAGLGQNHGLQVVSPADVQAKGIAKVEDARREFGATLGLLIALEQTGQNTRASYKLIDAKTNAVIAENSFDAPVADPFSVEDKIADAVAAALALKLRPDERQELTAHGTSNPEAYKYYMRARGYLEDPFKAENVNSAVILFDEALKLDPKFGFAKAGLGTAYWWRYELDKNKKWISQANENCVQAIELANAGAEGHVCLGLLANGTGRYQDAVKEFRLAVDLEPANDEAYIGLAQAYQNLGRLNEAEQTYEQVINLRPQYPQGYTMLGAFYLEQAQYDKAVGMFKHAVELAPESARHYSNLGGAYLAEAEYEQAIPALQHSISISPSFPAYNNLGTALLRVRRFNEAAAAYEQTLKLNDREYSVWGSLGDADYYAGKGSEAKKAYDKALELAHQQLQVNPNDAELLGNLADYYSMIGDRTQATSFLDRSLRLGHGNKDLLFNAAMVYTQLGDTSVALEWLRKALRAGYSASTVREAPSFDRLRDDPRFQELLRSQPLNSKSSN